ncbi:MAG: hypothetical protein GX957_12240 [Clostridiaceae bacterium]|nr:hypothetical protein [Clostridiaceae bacterium]
MNEKNNIRRIRSLINTAEKKISGMNKGSKILFKIGTVAFLAFLIIALLLEIIFVSAGIVTPDNLKLIEWTVTYSFRFWAMITFGAVILDILVNR